MAYGHILKDDFIAIPRLGTVNLHASLLPKYRGASPIPTAIAAGETVTGVTLMRIVRELDAGPAADEQRVDIDSLDTAGEVEGRLASACVPLLARALPRLAAGELRFQAQDASRATFCRRLTKADGAIDFRDRANVLAARINGLYPWPGGGVLLGGVQLKFGLARADREVERVVPTRFSAGDVAPRGGGNALHLATTPGQILEAGGEALRVGTGHGVLEILRLQRPGGRMLPAREFLRGFPIPAGAVLPSSPMPELVAVRPFKH
jgi:methionyl-tRNA formyltransferase